MNSNTVAFRGVSQVCEAYESNDMPVWAICSGKELMFCDPGAKDTSEGRMTLESTLKRLQQGGTRAILSLRVYETAPGGSIKSNTVWDRSFGFKLYDDEEFGPYETGRRSLAREAQDKIDKMEAELEIIKAQMKEAEEEAEPEKLSGVEGVLAGIMGMPGIKEFLSAKLIGFVNTIVPMGGTGMPAGIAGIEGPLPAKANVLKPGQEAKVNQALNILCALDPLLGDHLLGVASIAQADQGQYNFLIGMLKK